MVIVTDSGSTKADWVLTAENGEQSRLSSKGINPVFHSEAFITDLLQGTFNGQLPAEEVSDIYYYGAGCWDDVRKTTVARALQSYFRNADIRVMHDLEGAARATCGDEPGIACIMGTGSNSCLYDGHQLVDNVTNLGYLLGDEGSGTHLGKYLIRAYFYREIPADLMELLEPPFPTGKKRGGRPHLPGSLPQCIPGIARQDHRRP
jgi:glucosamine kinase